MDDGAVNAIANLQKQLDEKRNELELGFTKDRRPDSLFCKTLNSIREYLENNKDNVNPANCIVVCSVNEVVIFSEVKGAKNNRHTIMKVIPVGFGELTTDRMIPQESMIIELLTRCVRTETIDVLVTRISSMTYLERGQSDDDGISTDLMMSVSVLCNNGKPDKIVTLQPYRTFPEVVQPSSQFLVRVDTDNKKPVVGLYAADGGMWKVQAIKNITGYLKEILPEEVSVIS